MYSSYCAAAERFEFDEELFGVFVFPAFIQEFDGFELTESFPYDGRVEYLSK
jgi:hypothetical protein